MKKAIGASVIVLVLATSSFAAIGDILQGQEWGLGLSSLVAFNQGQGEAETEQKLNLFDTQTAGNVGLGTWATQMAAGKLSQEGEVEGNNVVGTVDQQLVLDGLSVDNYGQLQDVTPAGTLFQSQGVEAFGKQTLTKAGGPGEVEGENKFNMLMSGASATICSNASSLSVLGGEQESEIEGGPCSAGSVLTEVTAVTNQVQQVN